MVRLLVKHGGDEAQNQREFLYDCQSSSTIDEITMDVSEIANLQLQIQRLCLQLEPRVSPLLHINPEVTPLVRALSEAKSFASEDQVSHNKPLLIFVLRDHIRSIEREFIANYQLMGFPDSNFQQLSTDLKLLRADAAQLWWVGRELKKCKKLSDYIGKNENTKIKVWLLSTG